MTRATAGDHLDSAALAARWEREAAAVGGADAAVLLHEAGRLYEARLSDPARALGAYRAALAADPGHLHAGRALCRLALAAGDVALACDALARAAAAAADARDACELHLARARLLEQGAGDLGGAATALAAASEADPSSLAVADHVAAVAAAHRRHGELVRAYERCAERAGEPALAAAFLCAAAGIAEARLANDDLAVALALRAFELAPGDAAVRAEARRHADRAGRFEELARILDADARDPRATPADGALAACALARVAEERLSDPARAAAARAEARRLAGGDPVVLAELLRLEEARGAWPEVAEVLRAVVELAPPPRAPEEVAERVAAHLRLGHVCEERLGRHEDAVASYRAALALEPGHRGALAALGRAQARSGTPEQLLATFLAERVGAVDPRDRAQRCFKAAEVLEERLGRADAAIELLEEALSLDPAMVAAQNALERLYERTQRFAALAALLEREVDATPDATEQVDLLLRLAFVREERLGDAAAAAAACERALQITPGHPFALRTLASLYERAGRFAELVAALERLAALTADPARKVALLQRAGEALEERLSDDAAAIAAHERILQVDGAHLPSLRALGRLYPRAGRWSDLVAMHRAEARSAAPGQAASLQFRVGEVLEAKLGDAPGAIAAYREAVALDPAHSGALSALARLHRARGEWEPLVDVLRGEAAAAQAVGRKAALLCEVGSVHEQRLDQPSLASAAYREVLELEPGHAAALGGLARLLSAQGDWSELLRVRREQAARCEGPGRVAALLACAQLAADRLGDAAAAEESCRAALALAPADPAALVLLARLGATSPSVRADARRGLAERLGPGRAAVGLLLAAAQDRAAAGEDARAELARASAIAPAHPLAAVLAGAEPAAEEDASTAAARAAAAPSPADRGLHALRAAERWEEGGDRERALTAYREAAALDGVALPALAGLARLHRAAGDWAALAEVHQAEARALRDPALAADALLAAGEIALARLGDGAAAADAWRRALERDAASPAAERLADLLAQDDPGAACETLERAGRARPGPAAADAWLAASRLAAERLADVERALAAADAAVAASGGGHAALLARSRLLARAGRAADAARDLRDALGRGVEGQAAADVHLELAALYDGPLADRARATSHLNAAVAAAPRDGAALTRLARLHAGAGNWPAAADALRRLADLPDLDAPARAAHLVALAEVRAEGIGDVRGAAELCEWALAIVPGDPAAEVRLSALRARAAAPPDARERTAAAPPATGGERPPPSRPAPSGRPQAIVAAALDAAPPRRAPQGAEACPIGADPDGAGERAALLDAARRAILDDPARPECWRALHDHFAAAGAHDRAAVAAAVLRFLRASRPDDVAPAAVQPPSPIAHAVLPPEWQALRDPGERGPLSDVLASCAEALTEAAALPLPRERAGAAPAAERLVHELCHALAVEPCPVQGGDGAEVRLDPTDPPILRVGAELVRRYAVAEQRFLVGRAVARLRARSALAAAVGPAPLAELLAAAVRVVVPDYSGLGRPPDAICEAVSSALSRRARKALEAPAKALARGPAPDVASWHEALAATADRAGLLLAGDPAAALGALARLGGVPATADAAAIAAAVAGRAELRRLLVFAASEEHFRLRRRLRAAPATA